MRDFNKTNMSNKVKYMFIQFHYFLIYDKISCTFINFTNKCEVNYYGIEVEQCYNPKGSKFRYFVSISVIEGSRFDS